MRQTRTDTYSFMSKCDNMTFAQHKFEAWLLGTKPEDYCVGLFKGSARTVEVARTKFAEGPSGSSPTYPWATTRRWRASTCRPHGSLTWRNPASAGTTRKARKRCATG